MAKDSKPDADLQAKIDKLQNNAALLDPEQDKNPAYTPNKRKRAIRRQVYERYYYLQNEPARKEAEAEWELADKEYGMYFDPPDTDSWQADLHLPDAFAAIQTQEQERIERKSRPSLDATEESDEPIAELGNALMTYSMNTTGFDYQYYLGKLSAASRGTCFYRDYWRVDKRVVKIPTDMNEDGSIKYEEKEITDFDDDYTEWVRNEDVFPDERAKHIDECVDWVRREVINIEEFHRIYGSKPDFFDTEFVMAGGDTHVGGNTVWKMPEDVTKQDVEVLHYENRSVDAYWVVANNITICDQPLPTLHKELSLCVGYQYKIAGRFWGVGIPKVIHYLSEERRSIRNLNMDRQKIIVGGAFLHNNSYDIDDEDEVLYPGKFISIDTNGRPIGEAVQQLQMSDVPASYFRTEEVLLEDIRRASGIDDRITTSNSATTATQAAIVKESTLKRINLVSITNEMDTIVRIGKLKWSNLQFFSTIPRIERITEDNEEREEKVYRTVTVEGKKFSIVNENGKKALKLDDIRGKSAFKLSKDYAKYIDLKFDVVVNSDIFAPISKAIEQTKKTEMYSLLLGNPATLAVLDINGATADVLKVNNINPEIWMKNPTGSKKDMMMLAESENMVMAAGQPLDGTEGANEDHTIVHLMFTKTVEFQQLAPAIQQIIMDHILQEHDNNPATGSAASLMGAYGLGADQSGAQQPGQVAPAAPLNVGAGQTGQPQAQVADIQPTNFANPE
jgi:hypothetical protein